MKCAYCKCDYSLSQLQFVEDGMIPHIKMKRHRAMCVDCRNKPPAIDGKPSEPEVDNDPHPF